MEHLIDKACSCDICQKIDVMWGDPRLSKWETDFIDSVADFGWHNNYTEKQIAKINQIFKKQKKVWSEVKTEMDGCK